MKSMGYLAGLLILFMGMGLLVNVSGEVSYDHSYTDPSGDVVPNQNDNIDIILFSSERSGEDVLIKLKVVGDFSAIMITISLEVDGTDVTIAYTMGTITMVKGESMISPPPTISINGDTATFTIDGSDVEATSSFDLVEAGTYDMSSNLDAVETGYVPGDDDDTDDDDDEYNDDEMYAPDDEYENSNDPATETPTDSSISVDIKTFDFDWSKDGDVEEWSETMTGDTSGPVFTCAFTKVFYLKDGSTSGEDKVQIEWTTGPFNMPEMTVNEITMAMHFKGTGSGGADDWSEWEEYYYGKGEREDSGDMGSCVNIDEVDKVVIYVRAFSDEELNDWNQDSMDITSYYMGSTTDDDDDTTDDDTDDDDEEDGGDAACGEVLVAGIFILTAAVMIIVRKKEG
jgi:hypothetical protein